MRNTVICKLFFDGASRGNPGKAGAGAYIQIAQNNIELSKNLGTKTNNQAEYEGLLLGLTYVKQYLVDQFKSIDLQIRGDSKLIVEQIAGRWKVKNSKLISPYNNCISILRELERIGINWNIQHIPRELNIKADELANRSFD